MPRPCGWQSRRTYCLGLSRRLTRASSRACLVRRGDRLQAALALATNEDFKSALAPAAEYLKACRKLERSARSRARWTQAAIYTLLLAVIGGLLARMYDRDLRNLAYWTTTFRGHELAA